MTLKKTLLATFLLAFGFSPCINAETFSLLADIHVTPGNENEVQLKKVVEENIKVVMSNSLGFGGHNASIVIKKYEEA